MPHEAARITDTVEVTAGYQREPHETVTTMSGRGVATLTGPDGEVKQVVHFDNLITQVGDQVYGELGSGAASPNAPTGMRLGTGGATAASKTGAGAAIVTYVSGSAIGFSATFPQSALQGSARRITYQSVWAAGVATANGIDEAAITNETGPTDVAGTAANTTARAVLSPVVNKGASDTLTISWTHDLEGT